MTTMPETPPTAAADETTAPVDPQVSKLRSEAAGYRTRLRDAEAARDDAVATIRDMRAAAISAAVANVVANPATLDALGFDPADYIGDDHTADLEGARAAAEKLRDEHGLAAASSAPAPEAVAAAANAGGGQVPAHLIRGATSEEMNAHAAELLAWANELVPFAPIVPGEAAGSRPLSSEDWLKQAMNRH